MTEEEVLCIIKSLPNKTCSLDPIPTWIVKACAADLVLPITHIANSSLSSSIVPQSLKQAVITPIFKKANLDKEVLKNYRSSQTSAFFRKLLKKLCQAEFKISWTKKIFIVNSSLLIDLAIALRVLLFVYKMTL